MVTASADAAAGCRTPTLPRDLLTKVRVACADAGGGLPGNQTSGTPCTLTAFSLDDHGKKRAEDSEGSSNISHAETDTFFRTISAEPYETLFQAPQKKTAYHPARGNDHPARGNDTKDTILIRNLDTGEVLPLEMVSVVGSYCTQSECAAAVGPSSLGSQRPWQGWWDQKRDREQQLVRAASSGSLPSVKMLLQPPPDGDAPVSVDARSLQDHRTPFIGAAIAGAVDIMKALLEARADPSAQGEAGQTALHHASQRGRSDAAKFLVESRADILKETDDGRLALHCAGRAGHAAIVGLLLHSGGLQQLRCRCHSGETPPEMTSDVATSLEFKSHDLWKVSASGTTFEGDSYACRHICSAGVEEDAVLLRNSRADTVRRLLEGASNPCQYFQEESKAGPVPPKHRRPGFVTVRPVAADAVGPDSFVLQELLGKGSFGQVYHVKHKTTMVSYAMKVLQKSKVVNGNLLTYVMTERNVLSSINHPFIVSLHYAFQTTTHLVLVLQYCPCGNLQALIMREGTLEEDLCRIYTAEILLALIHLHERRIIFRDLKPDNVVISEEHHTLLTDFGLSKQGVVGLQGAKSFCGSMAFIAPEILFRHGHGRTVDIYGLGVVLYAMLVGTPPFYHPDRETLCNNIKFGKLKIPSKLPEGARSIIGSLLERKPAKRLGCKDTADVKTDPFFNSIEFDALMRGEVKIVSRHFDPPAPDPVGKEDETPSRRKQEKPGDKHPSVSPGRPHTARNSRGVDDWSKLSGWPRTPEVEDPTNVARWDIGSASSLQVLRSYTE